MHNYMYPVLNYAMLSFLKLFQLLYRRNSRPRSDLFHDLLKLSSCCHNDISADICSQGNEKFIQNKNKIKGEKNSEIFFFFFNCAHIYIKLCIWTLLCSILEYWKNLNPTKKNLVKYCIIAKIHHASDVHAH